MMYHVMIIEDDPMVASINRQYVEATPSFQTDRVFKSGAEALEYLKDHTTDPDHPGLLYSPYERGCIHRPAPCHGKNSCNHHGHLRQ